MSASQRSISRLAEPLNPHRVHVSRILSTLSHALDLTEGQPMGHAVRSCLIGMKLGRELGLGSHEQAELYYALLLKDAGCSSNASRMYRILGSDERIAKHDIKSSDWTRVSIETLKYLRRHVRPDRPARERFMAILRMTAAREEQSKDLIATRCQRGAAIARKMGFPDGAATAILNLDEHWNGQGFPNHIRGDEIPIQAQILNLAQTLEVYQALHSPGEAVDTARRRSGRWFNPALVRIVLSWGENDPIWRLARSGDVQQTVEDLAPDDSMMMDDDRQEAVCDAFAEVIDAKSPFTFRHSVGVAHAAAGIAAQTGLDARAVTTLRRAALLHDIGKLTVSNAILEKPGKLTSGEWHVVRRHPFYTKSILERAPVFSEFATMAAAHHEKLDGTGYHLGLESAELSLSTRILAVADIYDALTADRPYRKGMPLEKALAIIGEDAPSKLDADCVDALRMAVSCSNVRLPDADGCDAGACGPVPGAATLVSDNDAELMTQTRVF